MKTTNKLPKFPGLVVAYHGCDRVVARSVISGSADLKDSNNPYDWLGYGKYFWENSVQRAYDWAVDNSPKKTARISHPAVIGAIINMGTCLDLVDAYCISLVREAYHNLVAAHKSADPPLPVNKYSKTRRGQGMGSNDKVVRYLDCAVIEYLCSKYSFDTVRGVFLEGNPLYDGAGFHDKTHIQICVRNPDCILGYFSPRNI